jgi:hypothetical protein
MPDLEELRNTSVGLSRCPIVETSMIFGLVLIALLVTVVAVASIGALVDRTAREEAWRQIAIERRWNFEHRAPNE